MNILDRFMERVAYVTDNRTNHNYGPPGSRFTIKRCSGTGTTTFRGVRESDGQSGGDINAIDFDIDPKQFTTPVSESKMEKLPKWEESPDEYRNLSAIEIRGEDTIYLSSALRTTLRAKEGDKIVFAVDSKKGKKIVYISKDEDGDELNSSGEIKTIANCRVLLREFGQNVLFVDFSPVYNDDFPDLVFYKIGTKYFEQFNQAESTPKVKFNPSTPGYLEMIMKKPSSTGKVYKMKTSTSREGLRQQLDEGVTKTHDPDLPDLNWVNTIEYGTSGVKMVERLEDENVPKEAKNFI